jgi:hypothetical protein
MLFERQAIPIENVMPPNHRRRASATARQAMAWWVYKCNDNGQFHRGNWDYVFHRSSETQWGSTRIRGLRQLQPNDQIIAYQTDRNELVGLVQVVRLRRRGAFDEVIMRPVERIGANVKTLKQDHAAIAKIPAFQSGFPRTLYMISASDARTLIHAARKQEGTMNSLTASASLAIANGIQYGNGAKVGAGFGDAKKNQIIEQLAIRVVDKWYRLQGWSVISVESEKCGFDLRCKKDERLEEVEVKGVSGDAPTFIITAGEIRQAKSNPRFVLCIVTRTLSKRPMIHRFSGRQFLRKYRLDAVQYRALPRS